MAKPKVIRLNGISAADAAKINVLIYFDSRRLVSDSSVFIASKNLEILLIIF